MSSFIKLSTGQYPLHEGDIRLEHPEILESETGNTFPCPPDYAKVFEPEQPVVDITKHEYVDELPPQQIDGIWTKVWEVKTLTAEEITALEEMQKKMRPVRPQQDLSASGTAPNVIS